MSANKHAVNQAAINEGALSLITATALLAASATATVTATYVQTAGAVIPGVGTLEGGMLQQHAVEKVLTGNATGQALGGIFKTSGAIFDGDASIFAVGILPQPGGNLFAGADFSPTANFISPIAATPQGNASFTVDNAGVNFLLFAEMLYTAANGYEVEGGMTADPMIQLSGEAYYIHTAGWVEDATADITFTANEPRTIINEPQLFGGAEFTADITYKDLITATLEGTATAVMRAAQSFYANSDLSPTPAAMAADGLKRALPTAVFDSGDATFATVTARIKHLLNASMEPTVDFPTLLDSNVWLTQNAGYTAMPTTGSFATVDSVLSRRVEAEASADSTVYALSYTWTIQQAESDFTSNASYFSAAAILGPDSDVIIRPAEVKDFVHPEELKEFIRPLI